MFKYLVRAVNFILSPLALISIDYNLLKFKNIVAYSKAGFGNYLAIRKAFKQLKSKNSKSFSIDNFNSIAELGSKAAEFVGAFNKLSLDQRTQEKFDELKKQHQALTISSIFDNDDNGGHDNEKTIWVKTTDAAPGFFGFVESLKESLLSLFGGAGFGLRWEEFKIRITKKSNECLHSPHAMRTLCAQVLDEHDGLCKIDDSVYDVKTETGYNGLVTRLFEMTRGKSITDYEIDSYEAAIPKSCRA